MNRLLIFLFGVFFLASVAQAQNIAEGKISWKVVSWFDGQTGELHLEEGVLITNDDSLVRWYDQVGDIRLELNIEATQGNWSQPESNGSLLWFVNDSLDSGTVTIERKGLSLVARIIISTEAAPAIYELILSDFTLP